MSSAIEEIIRWAQGLPGWQADAVRRLLEQGDLTSQDKAELLQMLKATVGLAASSVEPVLPMLGGFSGTGQAQQPITLERILETRNVNAIRDGSTLPFGLSGMTVIYGQNGSGKSSFARILKRACRARDTKEPIHPNVFSTAAGGPAAATLKIAEGEAKGIAVNWVDGQAADERLTNVAFFDSKCARVIVDDNNEAVYIPYGCHVFDGMVELLKSLRTQLHNERPVPIEPSSTGILPASPSYAFLKQLSRHTSTEAVTAATRWTPADDVALQDTAARIAQSTTQVAIEKARRLRSLAGRATDLSKALKSCADALSSDVAATIQLQLTALADAERAAALAAQISLSGEPLPTGASNEWRLLYQAAWEYSTKVAYVDTAFPATGPGDRCVLCQQQLDERAASRLLRFKSFVEDKSEQVLAEVREKLEREAKRLRELNMPALEQYEDILVELTGPERSSAEQVTKQLIARRVAYDEAIAFRDPARAEAIDLSGTETLNVLADRLRREAEQVELDADPAALTKLEGIHDTLSSQKALSQIKTSISTYVGDKRREYLYEQLNNALNTRGISEKSKEIISASLSPQLQGDLRAELRKLGAQHLPLSVSITGRDGGARHQLALANSAKRAKLSEVLSEGELCVVAVAGFFAELGGSSAVSPIVLDDPITSLDHRYSRHVARRLVEEARRRQVIVFTHNLAFLMEIDNLCSGMPLCVQTVERTGSVPGQCIEGVPWEAMSVKDRLSYLDDQVNRIAYMYGEDDAQYNLRAAHLYGLLRQTWEAFIERELLNRTIARHEIDVQTKRLDEVEIVDGDCARVHSGMAKCSTWMAGHDRPGEIDASRPAPAEIRHDVQELRAFAKEMPGRRDAVRKRRKMLTEPVSSPIG